MLISKYNFFLNHLQVTFPVTKHSNKSFYYIREIMLIFKDILTIIKHIKLYLRQLKKYKEKLKYFGLILICFQYISRSINVPLQNFKLPKVREKSVFSL